MHEVENPARRTLDRLAFGPSPGAVERVAAQGPEAWIRSQLERGAPAARVAEPAPGALEGMVGRPRDREERRRQREALRRIGAGVLTERIERALAEEHLLFETLVDFWGNHFAIHAKKGPVAALLPSFENEVLRAHALGRFPELLLASARHPAMLLYLDNWRSAAAPAPGQEPPRRRRRRARRPDGPNENYARELLELHSLGDPHAFEQRDVEEVARAFTGWTLTRESGQPAFRFEPSWHDEGPKRVLGESLPAGGGPRDGERVLALLARHPATARSVARKLAVRFISDDPPEAAVARAAAAFRRSGGDISSTLSALLLDGRELFSANSVKVKTPYELVVSALRGTGARVAHARGVIGVLKRLGQLPYLAGTPAGYPDVEAAWIDPGAVLERTRFAFALSAEWIPGVRIAAAEALDVLQLPRAPLGASTRAALATPGLSARERIALALASPEFQLR